MRVCRCIVTGEVTNSYALCCMHRMQWGNNNYAWHKEQNPFTETQNLLCHQWQALVPLIGKSWIIHNKLLIIAGKRKFKTNEMQFITAIDFGSWVLRITAISMKIIGESFFFILEKSSLLYNYSYKHYW